MELMSGEDSLGHGGGDGAEGPRRTPPAGRILADPRGSQHYRILHTLPLGHCRVAPCVIRFYQGITT